MITSLESGQTASASQPQTHPPSPFLIAPYQLPDGSTADFPGMARNILAVRSTAFANPVFGAIPMDALQPERRHSQALLPGAPQTINEQPASLPPYDIACAAVETFFDANAMSYPFLDKGEFFRDMDAMYRRQEGRIEPGDANEDAESIAGQGFVIFMVIAVGTTNRERLGEVERGSSRAYRARAMQGLAAATSKEDIVGGCGGVTDRSSACRR